MISVNATAKKGRPSFLMAGLNCLFKVREGGKKACSVHVKFNEKNDGGKTPQSAHVTMSIRDDGAKRPALYT